MKNNSFLIVFIALNVIYVVVLTMAMSGQTQLSLKSQVSPAPAQTVQSLYFCTTPVGCSGIGWITLQNAMTGVLTPYVLIPPGTTVTFNPAQWQAVPLNLPRGTGVTCSHVKP